MNNKIGIDVSELDGFLTKAFDELGIKAVEPTPRETEALRVMFAENIRLTIEAEKHRAAEKMRWENLYKVEALFKSS